MQKRGKEAEAEDTDTVEIERERVEKRRDRRKSWEDFWRELDFGENFDDSHILDT